MGTKWIIQTSGFNGKYIEPTFNSLKKLNLDIGDFGVTSDGKISNLNDLYASPPTTYISRGGIFFLRIISDAKDLASCSTYIDEDKNTKEYMDRLIKSVDYNESRFDQNNYRKEDIPLLNSNSEYLTYEAARSLSFDKKMFVKPSKDLKSFSGGIVPIGITIEEFVKSNHFKNSTLNETIIISGIKHIYSECRFFVIDGQVITGSMYRAGNKTTYSSEIPQSLFTKAKEYANLYSPAEIFVMDLADTPDGVKIVEYNCWNCSGLYDSDIDRLFSAINEYKLINRSQ